MWRRIASWRGRDAVLPEAGTARAPDRDRLACAAEALRSSYGQADEDELMDDRLVALMLALSVEPRL